MGRSDIIHTYSSKYHVGREKTKHQNQHINANDNPSR